MPKGGATWIGGGIIGALTVPILAPLCLVLAREVGVTVGDLGDEPAAMIIVWGAVSAFIVASPVAFVLGALASQRRPPGKGVLLASAGGAVWGAVLGVVDMPDLGRAGWPLAVVGAVSGAVIGYLSVEMARRDR